MEKGEFRDKVEDCLGQAGWGYTTRVRQNSGASQPRLTVPYLVERNLSTREPMITALTSPGKWYLFISGLVG